MNPRHLEIIRLCEEGASLRASDTSRSLEMMRKAMETAQSEAEWLTVLELLTAREIGFLLACHFCEYIGYSSEHGGACFLRIPNSENAIFIALDSKWKWHATMMRQPEAFQALYNIAGHIRVRSNAGLS